MGHPDVGRYVSRDYLRWLAWLWFLAGVACGEWLMVAIKAAAS